MLKVHDPRIRIRNLEARMPFRYGIATMTALPHVFVSVDCEVDGTRERGVAADHLAPKWFTKDPETSFRDDIADMLEVIRGACALAESAPAATSVFELWRRLYAEQGERMRGAHPPLLWNFGVSLVERAVIDAFCRAKGLPFHDALGSNALGIQLGEIHRELGSAEPSDLLAERPLRSTIVRHTVGLSDPLTDAEIPPDERVDDGLPQSLEACIREYGLTHFKLKIAGEGQRDLQRLRGIAKVLDAQAAAEYRVTLDGNEQFRTVEAFQAAWQRIRAESELTSLLERLLFVEQPLHRAVALTDDTARALTAWADRPPMIIDEADARVEDLPRAIECGYSGTSHKNCKGVLKGIANACLIEHRRRTHGEGAWLLSGEDLSNVGPIALPQDLTVMASIGVEHVERNGHHYFAGLSMYDETLQSAVERAHPDLYRRHESGFVTLRVEDGRAEIGSVVDAPFGYGFEFEVDRYPPAEAWRFESLGLPD